MELALISVVPSAPSLVLAVSVIVAAALACIGVAVRLIEPPQRTRSIPATRGAAGAARSGGRPAVAVAAGFLVLLATRWVVLAAAASVLVWWWGRLVHDARAEEERLRLEGIAKWLEDLRDTLRGSAMGAEEALETVAHRAPEAIRDSLTVFVLRRRQGLRTEDALVDLAEALAHPTADAAIAAIRLVVGGASSAGRLHPTVNALAAAARDEVGARERVDRTRSVYQSSMRRLIFIAAAMIGYLRIAAGDLLQAYDTPAGQIFLMVPLALWAGCVVWLRSLCKYEPPRRYSITGSDPQIVGVAT